MKGSRALLITLAMATGLLVLSVALRGTYAHVAAEHWRSQLDTVPDQRAGILLGQVAELGDPGIPVLVEALGSERESVARAGEQVLHHQIERWRLLRAPASSAKLAVLADSLAEHVERFGPAARNDATELATLILLWPLDPQAVDRRQVIACCEEVFRAGTAGDGALTQGSLAVWQAGHTVPADADTVGHQSPADDQADAGRLLVGLSRFPGGGLPIESFPQPAPPQRAGEGGPNDSQARQPRPVPFPPPAEPLSTWQESDREWAVPEPLAALSDPPAPSDRPPSQSDTSRTISLAGPLDSLARSPPAEFREMDTFELMQWLDCRQESEASGVRAELVRRGFSGTDLEIARRLFDPDAEVRKQLARQLPGVQGVDAVPWLLWLSRDPDPEVRLTAIGLIATTGDAALLEQIEGVAREDPDPQIRRQGEVIAARRRAEGH